MNTKLMQPSIDHPARRVRSFELVERHTEFSVRGELSRAEDAERARRVEIMKARYEDASDLRTGCKLTGRDARDWLRLALGMEEHPCSDEFTTVYLDVHS